MKKMRDTKANQWVLDSFMLATTIGSHANRQLQKRQIPLRIHTIFAL